MVFLHISSSDTPFNLFSLIHFLVFYFNRLKPLQNLFTCREENQINTRTVIYLLIFLMENL